MFITRKHLSRRMVLRGLGAAVALPWLDSMTPALTALAKSGAAPARRLGVFYVPNGMALPYWWPQAPGSLERLPPTLQSLQPFKDSVLVIGGLSGDAVARKTRGGGHSSTSGTYLSCVPFQGSDANVIASTTMDQIAAKQLARETQIASLELGMESAYVTGECETSCALTNSISWSTPTTPLAIDNDPRSVFERLFGQSGSTDPAVRLAHNRRSRSILDVLTDQVARLNALLGPKDQAKFEEYLDSIRDVERRIAKAEEQSARELPVIDQPMGIPGDYGEHAAMMMDLLALAYQTDLTRVCTFMLGRELSSRAYPEAGVSDSHHPLSHHQNQAANIDRLSRINEYHVRQFSHLVRRLSTIEEGDGTLLDHSLLVYGAGISDSNVHSWVDLPIAVVGGKKAGVRSGRYVRYPDSTPLANLHLTLLDRLGVQLERFGNSTERLELGDRLLSGV